MASQQPGLAEKRDASGRAPANTSRPLRAASVNSNRSTAGNTSIPPASAIGRAAAQSSSNNIPIFLSNLSLLDLDLREDWPGITTLTFSSRDGGHGQKKRIQCVEWALYQLFALWDPMRARADLQPLFPAHDQKQSLDLRAALLRNLEQIKKEGVLGRDVILRKTMLDECKGERLEEVLAVLSSAVLKRVVARNAESDNHVLRLATEDTHMQVGKQDEMQALMIALRHSIRKLVDGKSTAQAWFADFAELLALRERSVLRRQEVVQALGRTLYNDQSSIDERERAHFNAAIREGWTGKPQWAETLLQGDQSSAGAGLLSTAVSEVWDKVSTGRLGDIEQHERRSAIQELDTRVHVQQERLRRWEAFSRELKGENSRAEEEQNRMPTRRTLALGFNGPRPTLAGQSRRTEPLVNMQNMPRKYEMLLQDMEEELSLRTESPRQRQAGTGRQQPETIGTKLRPAQEREIPRDRAEPAVQVPQATHTEADEKISAPESDLEALLDQPPEDRAAPTHPDRQRAAPSISVSVPAEAELFTSPTGTTSPPKKARHVLSLADRTRLSMARQSTRQLPDDLDDLDIESPLETMTAAPPSKYAAQPEEPDESGKQQVHEDLLSRTRKSMAGFEAAQAKARLERRKSQRKSRHMPPIKASGGELDELAEGQEAGAAETSLLLAESLLAAGGEDEEAVFKSRPKIKTSPAGTPKRFE